jgi:hypothetical protein
VSPDGWFIVRAQPTDQTLPPAEERYSRFGEALDRALEMGSALQFRSVMLTDAQGVAYATFNMLWTIPRELR